MFVEAISFNLYTAGLVHVKGEGEGGGEGRERGKEVGVMERGKEVGVMERGEGGDHVCLVMYVTG